ncbi:hypothetical protein FVEG_02629 [Fusarium verticillioides 7600]|uniref:Uncharacterized protein n=1 Tax=Gibberella moniliformis (strain M3125 / FGSC 7600) TaxID=334819 RepID=W7M5B8_GIBM7|nr:hypothetical protein FVEG_02629 [Fusarium verticillioides 7600]EWG40072.1 hypothetical protein FVEG_02629 [Fusarium verticillioides 7600]
MLSHGRFRWFCQYPQYKPICNVLGLLCKQKEPDYRVGTLGKAMHASSELVRSPLARTKTPSW